MSNNPLIDALLSDLALSKEQFLRIASRAPRTYKIYPILKKNGGIRVIAQPARETKYIQSWLANNVFGLLPVHDSATAYRKGSSIKVNAQMHAANPYIVKLDFTNFFPSIKSSDVFAHLKQFLIGATDSELKIFTLLSCFNNNGELCLSIGSPLSPGLSNSIMYEFDSIISDWAAGNNFIYTRYADDLTFSTPIKGASEAVVDKVREVIGKIAYPRLSLNEKKTIHLSRKGCRRVTGLVLSNSGSVSIGRDKKREISAMVHRFSIGKISHDDLRRLQGLLGFVQDVEPLFIARLRAKYSSAVVVDLLRRRVKKESDK
ncbi:retron St85 family RNA-directed DNA polymerase [Pseudomonas sp. PA27(2017)]|uniref:retron St85 family RNA-directed DNA polymerase n=1 Tax=Pseudomonas sp. PA27(2017) TaxID=1932112 RepID=UPI000958FEA2|nr:retron St85 family RNA-directed DNA polymerase [Pseudomonas sp. PA27(2017)]OLU23924.1 hypothetical protein BVH06_22395 [Pseudomonas sp. PA27(2017)]